MRMLVTGGAGFIGANFVHYTSPHHPEHEVTVLDALTYAGNEASLAPVRDDIEFVHGDVADAALVDELVGRHDVVVHFAAESHNDNSLRRPVAVRADQPRRHVHAPRGGAQARRPAAPHLHRRGLRRPRARRPGEVHRGRRRTTRRARTPSTKAGSDLLVRAWVRSFGIHATISNCSNNYGPYQHVEKFIPRQITNVLDGAAPQALRRGRERARLDPRRRPQRRRARDPREGPRRARPT